MEDRYGPWAVRWRPDGFSVAHARESHVDSFSFDQIILPVEIIILTAVPDSDRAILKTGASRAEVLIGVPKSELEKFKRKVSQEVLAAVRNAGSGCSDCAKDAGTIVTIWAGIVCAGCREHYCRNTKCLRRLRLVLRGGQSKFCKYCGEQNDHGPLTVSRPTFS